MPWHAIALVYIYRRNARELFLYIAENPTRAQTGLPSSIVYCYAMYVCMYYCEGIHQGPKTWHKTDQMNLQPLFFWAFNLLLVHMNKK